MSTKFYTHTESEPPEENTPDSGVPHETGDLDTQLAEMQRKLDAILAAVNGNEEE